MTNIHNTENIKMSGLRQTEKERAAEQRRLQVSREERLRQQSDRMLATVTAVRIQQLTITEEPTQPCDWRLVTEKTLQRYLKPDEGKQEAFNRVQARLAECGPPPKRKLEDISDTPLWWVSNNKRRRIITRVLERITGSQR